MRARRKRRTEAKTFGAVTNRMLPPLIISSSWSMEFSEGLISYVYIYVDIYLSVCSFIHLDYAHGNHVHEETALIWFMNYDALVRSYGFVQIVWYVLVFVRVLEIERRSLEVDDVGGFVHSISLRMSRNFGLFRNIPWLARDALFGRKF